MNRSKKKKKINEKKTQEIYKLYEYRVFLSITTFATLLIQWPGALYVHHHFNKSSVS